MKTSRQRLFEFIQSKKVVTVAEISQALRMTPANARHHLNILKERGLVEIIGEQPPNGRGRPAQLFGLSEQTLGDNLDRLVHVLLEELLSGTSHEQSLAVLQRAAARMFAATNNHSDKQNRDEALTKRSLTGRLYKTVQRLNELNYHAHWEAHAAGPRLIFGHCPFSAVVADHPELCLLDKFLLEELLDCETIQKAKLVSDQHGSTYCLFAVKGKKSHPDAY